jgi:dATP pyrophosphohydrolase
MPRAPFQVAIFPFRPVAHEQWEYAIFRRSVEAYWQSIAGGGEDGESPDEAARRETHEEAGLPLTCRFVPLRTTASVPVTHFHDRQHWDADLFVIPVHYFGVDAANRDIRLCREHSEYRWLTLDAAVGLLQWDSDKTALWELAQHLSRSGA